MELYFLRHGIAADVGPEEIGDAGRPLTTEGAARMREAARGLRRLDLRPYVLLTSPLVRALQTAEIVARELELELRVARELAPGCDLTRLRELVLAQRAPERLMLVGHEPDFSTLVSMLIGGGHILLKKGGLARVDLEELVPGTGTLVWLLPPRALRRIGH